MAQSKLMARTRVGKICYTNCLPFFYDLSHVENNLNIEYMEAVPSVINQAMREGRIDVAPISSLEYLNHQDKYLILSDFVIGSRDFSGSVLLFSKEKIEGLDGAAIGISTASLSSAVLLKILLKFKYQFENTFIESSEGVDRMLEKLPAALIIGDEALFYQPKDFVYKYDLSELWWNWTMKPFCFAVWVVRHEFAKKYPEEVAFFAKKLKQNLEENLQDLEKLLKQALGLTFMHERFSKIFGYLFNLNYGLDAAMLEGLELYYRLAHRLGVSPRPEKLGFFPPAGS